MILGLVAAKDNSNRFPGKNKHLHNGEPLFWHSVKPLLNSKLVDDVYVITDSKYIKAYCEERGVGIIWRPKNASKDEDKLITILRWAYYSLDVEYRTVVAIMANCPGHTSNVVDLGIHKLNDNNLLEVRSFDNNGLENGLLVLDKKIITDNRDISYYLGMVKNNAKEIHYETEL